MRDDEPRLSSEFEDISRRPWLTALLEQMPVGIGMFDESGQLMFGNRHFSEEPGVVESLPDDWVSISPDGKTVGEGVFPCVRMQASRQVVDSMIPIYLIHPKGCGDDLSAQLHRSTHRLSSFESTEDFLNVAEVLQPGCVIVDLRSSRPSSSALLKILQLRPSELQVVLLGAEQTPAADVIAALRAGAADYLLEPAIAGNLAAVVKKASDPLRDSVAVLDDQAADLNQRLLSLPRRERQVMLGLVAGGTNKTIARSLQLSPRTVEVHRSHLMQRLNVRTLTELLHLVRDAGLRAA